MLYELIGIVRPGNLAEVKEIVLTSGQQVLRGGGVIRSLVNWGVFPLSRTIYKNENRYKNGHYFVMRYDANADTQHSVRKTLSLDVRVLRTMQVKMGDNKLGTMSKFGPIQWSRPEGQ